MSQVSNIVFGSIATASGKYDPINAYDKTKPQLKDIKLTPQDLNRAADQLDGMAAGAAALTGQVPGAGSAGGYLSNNAAIARAVASDPKVLGYDGDPTSFSLKDAEGLDDATRQYMFEENLEGAQKQEI